MGFLTWFPISILSSNAIVAATLASTLAMLLGWDDLLFAPLK
jgi:uncharacterized membrane protein YgaE (UPF0421/DUF939 family)